MEDLPAHSNRGDYISYIKAQHDFIIDNISSALIKNGFLECHVLLDISLETLPSVAISSISLIRRDLVYLILFSSIKKSIRYNAVQENGPQQCNRTTAAITFYYLNRNLKLIRF